MASISSSRIKAKEVNMETRATAAVYQDFVPSHEWVREEGVDNLVIELSEFKKEQIRVQLDNFGKLRISGERPLADNRRSRFRMDFQVPDEYNISEIKAKFENGHLHVTLPKLITEAIPKKKEDEKRGKPTDTRKDAEKGGKMEKDQTKEKKGKEMVPSDVKHEEGEKGGEKDQTKEKKGKEMVPRDVKHEEGEKGGEKDQTEEKKGKEKVTSDVKQEEGEKGGEKDQTEEKKGKEKVTSDVKQEEGEKGGAMTDVPKKEATTESAAPGNGQNGLGKLKLKVGDLDLEFYNPRQLTVNVIVAVMVLVGAGLYVTYKLRSAMEKDGP